MRRFLIGIILLSTVFPLRSMAKNPTEDRIQALEERISRLENRKLYCQSSPEVKGNENQWSPWALCPKGFVALGVAKLDLLGKHDSPTLHINDLRCNKKGCKVWCVGAPCNLSAQCCNIKN